MSMRPQASWGTILRALLLGHVAAVAGFCGAISTSWLLTSTNLRTLQPGAFLEFAKAAAGLTILTFIFMLPVSIFHAPFVILAVVWPRGSAIVAGIVGALVGAGENFAILASSDGFTGPWTRIGAPGDPRTGVGIMLCGAVAGIAYALVVWRFCIRRYG